MKNSLLIIFSLALIASSCKLKRMDPIVEPGEVKILVSSQVNKTKAKSTDGFMENSQIGIFSAVETTDKTVDILDLTTTKDHNFVYQASSNSNFWNPIDKPIFFDPYKDITLYSYYPASTTPNSPNSIDINNSGYIAKYNTVTDQSSVDKLQLADLMYAKFTGVSNVNNNVTLPFSHKLAKVRFSITKDAEWGAANVYLSNVSITGANVHMQANLSLVNGNLVPVHNDNINTVQWNAPENAPIILNASAAYDIDLIIIPASCSGTIFSFVANDQKYEYLLKADANFSEATNHIYKIKILPTSAIQPIIVEPSIQDWDVNTGIIIRPR